jgi:integrase
VIADYKQHMLDQQKSVTSINGDLRTIRRMLRLAHEWGVISRSPVIHELPGGKGRERVISFDEERRYLEAAGWNRRTLATLAVDTGLRPNSELFCIEWQNVCLEQIATAPFGYLRVVDGKTKNAVRTVPLTRRGRSALLNQLGRKLHERWVFPGPGNAGHQVTLQHSHEKALNKSGVTRFPFYSWRHTFGTRCAESGMDRFTLAKLMGHSSPQISERYYIHITESHVAHGFEKFLNYQEHHLKTSDQHQ